MGPPCTESNSNAYPASFNIADRFTLTMMTMLLVRMTRRQMTKNTTLIHGHTCSRK